jgi:hypothetical protein
VVTYTRRTVVIVEDQMPISRKSVRMVTLASVILFVVVRVGVMRYLEHESRPLGESRRIESSAAGVSQLALVEFLNRDFNIVTDVRALPGPVLQKYTEQGGSRLLMANPGQKFEVGDLIRDASVPRERLIFAGIAGDNCFVHYERGGRAHMYIVDFFRITSTKNMESLWSSYCDAPAANSQDLRSQLLHGACSRPPISR